MILIVIYSLLIFIIAFVPILREIKYRKFDLFNCKNAFILYYVIQLNVSGILSLNFPYESITTMDLQGSSKILYFQKAYLASLLGILFFQIGYYFSNNKRFSVPTSLPKNWKKENINALIFVYFFLGILSFISLVKANGGLTNFEREGFRAGGMIGQGFLIYPATKLLSIAVLMYYIWIFKNRLDYLHKSCFIKAFILFLLSICPALIMGFRGFILLPLVSLILVYNYKYKKINIRKFIPIGSIILVIFVIYGIYRELPAGIKISPHQFIEVAKDRPELAYAFLSRSKGIEVVATEIKKLDKTSKFEFGYKSFFEMLTIPIPKKLWKEKPTPSSIRFTTYFFGDNLNYSRGVIKDDWGGVSPTIIGEAYWNFGWIGIIIGLYAFGWFSKKIYLTFINNLDNSFIVLIYTIIFNTVVMSAEAVQGNINGLMLDIGSMLITIFILKVSFKKSFQNIKEIRLKN